MVPRRVYTAEAMGCNVFPHHSVALPRCDAKFAVALSTTSSCAAVPFRHHSAAADQITLSCLEMLITKDTPQQALVEMH